MDYEDIVNRPESAFPLARTEQTRYYLQPDNTLSLQPGESGSLSYQPNDSGKLVFECCMPSSIETTGYFMAHLLVSCPDHDEMDIFVQVEKFSPTKQ